MNVLWLYANWKLEANTKGKEMQPKFRRIKEKRKIFSNAWEFKKIKAKVVLNRQNAMIKQTNPDTSKILSDISTSLFIYLYIYIYKSIWI